MSKETMVGVAIAILLIVTLVLAGLALAPCDHDTYFTDTCSAPKPVSAAPARPIWDVPL